MPSWPVRAVLLAAVLGGAAAAPGPGAADIWLGGRDVEIELLTDELMSPEAVMAFLEMAESAYYGAFVYNPAEGAWGAVGHVHSLAFARQRAMQWCRYESRQPSACREFALVAAKGYRQHAGDTTLNYYSALEFRAYLKARKAGQFSAFAISPFGPFGTSGNVATRNEAVAAALAACRQGVQKVKRRFRQQFRGDPNYTRQSDWQCRIIHVQKGG